MAPKRRRTSSPPPASPAVTAAAVAHNSTAAPATKRRRATNADNAGVLQNGAATPSSKSSETAEDRLSQLSDELLIRILHQLPAACVLVCQLISRKWQRLATDPQVWKSLYYTRFVLPRALRLPGKEGGIGTGAAYLPGFASRRSKWLDEEKLLEYTAGEAVGGRKRTDWKARYRLRHNWSKGAADIKRIELGSGSGRGSDGDEERGRRESRLMVRLVNGIVVTADAREGLRAWDVKASHAGREGLASCPLSDRGENSPCPSSLAVDTASGEGLVTGIAVGFSDGGVGIWKLKLDVGTVFGRFCPWYRRIGHARTVEEKGVSGIAYAHPYLLTISEQQVLSLYGLDIKIPETADETGGSSGVSSATEMPSSGDRQPTKRKESSALKHDAPNPQLLASLRSHTTWPPLSLSIRSTPTTIIASIAYALPTYLSGWSVGLQELHLTPSGEISRSRLASAVDSGFKPLLSSPSSSSRSSPSPSPAATDGRGRITTSRPTTLSYAHPYLLASHADNTLGLYLVTSNASELKISKGTTLWGHTSSVAGAQIGGRGKAVSSSARGDELRVWELEGGTGRKRMLGDRSVRIRSGSLDAVDDDVGTGDAKRGWVGFDEEVVVVMKEDGGGGQSLMIYDFT